MLTSALTKSHLSGAAVYVPQIVDGKILQSQTLTPLRTDPRFRDATDTVTNGAGGSAPRRMTLDGAFMVPKTLDVNRLTVGKHTQTASLQDTAGPDVQVREHVRGHDLVRRPRDRDRPVRGQRAAHHAQRRAGRRRDRPAAREPGRLPRRPGDRRRLGRQRRDRDDRQGAQHAADAEHDAERRRRPRARPRSASRATRGDASPARTRRRNNGPIVGQPIVLDTAPTRRS